MRLLQWCRTGALRMVLGGTGGGGGEGGGGGGGGGAGGGVSTDAYIGIYRLQKDGK